MQEQEYKLNIPDESIYNKIYENYLPYLKQAKIMISDYFDTPNLDLLKKKIIIRHRIDDGRHIIQTKKTLRINDDDLFVSESKEEIQSSIEASKMYHWLCRENNIESLVQIATIRTMRQLYFTPDFDFILDKSQYINLLNQQKGNLYELEMEILSFDQEDRDFLLKLQTEYHLTKSRKTKIEKIFLNNSL